MIRRQSGRMVLYNIYSPSANTTWRSKASFWTDSILGYLKIHLLGENVHPFRFKIYNLVQNFNHRDDLLDQKMNLR